jgi:hypothetical protein
MATFSALRTPWQPVLDPQWTPDLCPVNLCSKYQISHPNVVAAVSQPPPETDAKSSTTESLGSCASALAIQHKSSRPNFIKPPNRRQFDRDEPNGIGGWSLCTEQAIASGSQKRRKGATEHWSLALGLLLGCLILKYVPMLHKDAVFNAGLVSEI